VRGIKHGDIIMVPLMREINTPLVNDSYMESAPTIALEPGRRKQHIQ